MKHLLSRRPGCRTRAAVDHVLLQSARHLFACSWLPLLLRDAACRLDRLAIERLVALGRHRQHPDPWAHRRPCGRDGRRDGALLSGGGLHLRDRPCRGHVSLLAVTIVGCGLCVIGGQSFINVLSAVLYPTACDRPAWAGRSASAVSARSSGRWSADCYWPRISHRAISSSRSRCRPCWRRSQC